MTVLEFCERFKKKNDTEKVTYANSVIKTKYVPYLSKMLLCKEMAKKSLAVNDKGITYIDMSINKINFIATIIALYTTLEYTKNENNVPETAKGYDALRESKAIDAIMESIGEDIQELLNVNQTCIDAVYSENCSMEAFIAKQFEKVAFIFSGMTSDVLAKIGEEMSRMDADTLSQIKNKLEVLK